MALLTLCSCGLTSTSYNSSSGTTSDSSSYDSSDSSLDSSSYSLDDSYSNSSSYGSSSSIVGTWYNSQYSTDFVFNSDGPYITGSSKGTYELKGDDTLILNQPSGKSNRFIYTIDDDEIEMISEDCIYLLQRIIGNIIIERFR